MARLTEDIAKRETNPAIRGHGAGGGRALNTVVNESVGTSDR